MAKKRQAPYTILEIRTLKEGSLLKGYLEKHGVHLHDVLPQALRSDFCTIQEAPSLAGVGYTQYIRALLSQGKLEGVSVQYRHYSKWLLFKPSLRSRPTRTDGRKYLLYFDQQHEKAVRDALDSVGIQYRLELAYKGDD